MRIESSSLNVFFPQIQDIRRQLFTFEDAFDSFQKPFTLTPLPDNAPPEIPRICAVSKNQHSQLNITTQNIQISTIYEDNYAYDLEKCFAYISNKISQIEKGVENTIVNNVLFSGLTVKVVYREGDDPVHSLAERFARVNSNMELMDLSSRLTYTLDNRYYINVTVENARKYSGIQNGLSIAGLKQESESIIVTADINDRYAFNKDENYRSSIGELETIKSITKNILINNVAALIDKGEFKYE